MYRINKPACGSHFHGLNTFFAFVWNTQFHILIGMETEYPNCTCFDRCVAFDQSRMGILGKSNIHRKFFSLFKASIKYFKLLHHRNKIFKIIGHCLLIVIDLIAIICKLVCFQNLKINFDNKQNWYKFKIKVFRGEKII